MGREFPDMSVLNQIAQAESADPGDLRERFRSFLIRRVVQTPLEHRKDRVLVAAAYCQNEREPETFLASVVQPVKPLEFLRRQVARNRGSAIGDRWR